MRELMLLLGLCLSPTRVAAQAVPASFHDLLPLHPDSGSSFEIRRMENRKAYSSRSGVPLIGAAIGAMIDGFITKPIYASPRKPVVLVQPIVGLNRAELTARIRF